MAIEKEDTLSFFKRFSFHTNTVDWLLTTPNVGIELDFSGAPESHFSVLVNGKYNWNTRHTVNPRFVYNIGAVSMEVRKYWRTGGKWEGHRFKPFSRYTSADTLRETFSVPRDTTVSLPRWGWSMFRRNVLSGRTFASPRFYRAYYAGLYVGYEKFTYAWGKKGRQGDSYNFGLSGGWSCPLYFLRNGSSIDIDLGLTLGCKVMAYDEFGYEEETGCHVYEHTRGRHFLPYPVVQEIRLGFAYRFRTVNKKVQGGADRYEIWEDSVYFLRRNRREKKRERNWYMRDSTFKAMQEERKAEQKKRDSLREERLKADTLELKAEAYEQNKTGKLVQGSMPGQVGEPNANAKDTPKKKRKKKNGKRKEKTVDKSMEGKEEREDAEL